VAEYVCLFAEQDGLIHASHLPEQFAGGPSATAPPPAGKPSEDALRVLLREHLGNVSKVANALGVHRQQAYRWLARANLEPSDFRD
jgi:transcriptional regulator of acetoin/glycerol metabolism